METGMKQEAVTVGVLSLVILLCLFFFRESMLLPPSMMKGAPSPALFPQIALSSTLLFALLMLRQSWVTMRSSIKVVDFKGRALCIHGVLLVCYPLVMNQVGYLPASVAYLFIALRLQRTGWFKAGLIAVSVSVALYALFHVLLRVQLPVWVLF